jgi:hypothetical protein
MTKKAKFVDNTTVYSTKKTPRPDKIMINGKEFTREDLIDKFLKVLEIPRRDREYIYENGRNQHDSVNINGHFHEGQDVFDRELSGSEVIGEELVNTLVKLGDRNIDFHRYEHIIEFVEQSKVANVMWWDLESLIYDAFTELVEKTEDEIEDEEDDRYKYVVKKESIELFKKHFKVNMDPNDYPDEEAMDCALVQYFTNS